MRIVVTIQHPAHVHFFRNAIEELDANGHDVRVFAREREVALDLLDAYGIEYRVIAGSAGSLPSLAAMQAVYEARLLRAALRFRPDVIAAVGGVAAAHVAAVVGARSVVFYDTEHADIVCRLAYPFADVVCTPDCYADDVGEKQRRYPGYHELAYLHPDRFTPDAGVLDDLDLARDDAFAVLRIVDWGASHDVGQGGFDDVPEVVDRLEDAGARVLLTAEGDLPADLEPYRVAIEPHRMHDLLSYADLFVGEGATMAAESAVLGTPAVYVNTLSMGYTDELESRYRLLFGFRGPERQRRALEKAVSIIEEADEATWQYRRERLLAEKTDATDVIVEQVTAAPAAEAT